MIALSNKFAAGNFRQRFMAVAESEEWHERFTEGRM